MRGTEKKGKDPSPRRARNRKKNHQGDTYSVLETNGNREENVERRATGRKKKWERKQKGMEKEYLVGKKGSTA